ncbi:MAG: TatD family hydrolase [Candidatus Saccharibacteria bacterium]|nr:TatD family hydrolase [Candidatus Saccharibacteria bacterium]
MTALGDEQKENSFSFSRRRRADNQSVGLVDTHCHLHDREFFSEEQAEEMLKRAREKGIEKIICIGTSHEDSLAARDFAINHDNVYWTYGIHPEGATENVPVGAFRSAAARELAPSARGDGPDGRGPDRDVSVVPIAIGEVGLDYHYEGYDREAQIKLFEEMLQLARDNDLPVSFHVREAFEDFFAVIANFPEIKGVVHSFSDNKKNLKRILENTDFYIGVNGLATYSTLPTPPLERIILETDAPFLTPVPFRGKINECGYIREIAEWLSNKLDTSFDQVEKETTKNAEKLFKF